MVGKTWTLRGLVLKTSRVLGIFAHDEVQSHKAVSAYFTSKQIYTALWLCRAE